MVFIVRLSFTLLCFTVCLLTQTAAAFDNIPSPFTFADYEKQIYRLFLCSGRLHIAHTSERTKQHCTLTASLISNFSFLETGWDFAQVTAEPDQLAQNATQAYWYAGYLEGYVTAVRINEVVEAFGNTVAQTPENQLAWVKEHVSYMETHSSDPNATPFWKEVGKMLALMKGIAAGYDVACKNVNITCWTYMDIFLLNFSPELGDVAAKLGEPSIAQHRKTKRHQDPWNNTDLHCSGFIKVTPDDLYMSHATWGAYYYMVRQYKVYQFETTVAMSACAGCVASGDDWYITSNKLASQETTNGFYNKTLYNYIVPTTVSEFLRTMVANFLGRSGEEWVELFATQNSGTYCNQYMVVDYNRYTPGQQGSALQDGLLWVAEQIPGNVTSADMTEVLRQTTYWASFNTPFFPNIYNISGFLKEYEKWGSLFSYTKYARPEIFLRNNTDVSDLDTMRGIMRYNDWQNDPLSWIPNCTECNPRGNPTLAIANRADLVGNNFVLPSDKKYAEFFYGSAFGAIDAKIASFQMWNNSMQGNAVCGPTTDQQTPFRWSGYQPGGAPPGSPDLYNFSWVFFNVVQGL